MSVTFVGLMCHAPIVIPVIGGAERGQCARTTRAMREIAQRAVSHAPERLVLVSPHSPRARENWGAWDGRHVGDLAAFRAPQLRIDLPDAPEVAEAVHGRRIGRDNELDHGAMVPLWFLWEAGWRGPTAILSQPWVEEAGGGPESIGRRIAALPGRTVVIASGDMSHRLKPGAPAGYHPHAQAFDRAFVQGLESQRWEVAIAAPGREAAAEDVITSTRVAMGAAGRPLHAEVVSYEGPFGVGYTEAVLYDDQPPLYAIARQAIHAAVQGRPFDVPRGGGPAAGVFVTLHKRGELRGCVGTILGRAPSLWEEVAGIAPESALSDDRFEPVRPDELPELHIEVSVLEPPEPVKDPATLDPARWGVIMTSGRRRALLLPDIDGIDTVATQLDAVRRKAGIPPGAPVELERFSVRKEEEP